MSNRERNFRKAARVNKAHLWGYRNLDPKQPGQPQAGAVNAYGCPDCNSMTITVHRDPGTTPMFLGCRNTPGCRGRAISLMYRPVQGDPGWEWYRPDEREFARLDGGTALHVSRGGLLLRPLITDHQETSHV